MGAQRKRSQSEGRWSIRKADEACGPFISERPRTRPGRNRRKENNRIIEELRSSQGHETMSLALFYSDLFRLIPTYSDILYDLGYDWDELNF